MFCRKGVLRNSTKSTGKHLCHSLFFNMQTKETLAQVFPCEFCEISKNTFSYRTSPVTAYVVCHLKNKSVQEDDLLTMSVGSVADSGGMTMVTSHFPPPPPPPPPKMIKKLCLFCRKNFFCVKQFLI